MASPAIVLGVPVMDEDHGRLEQMLQGIDGLADAELPDLFHKVEAETRAHFGHEEDAMRAADVPILHCHIMQHALFLEQFAIGHAAVASGDYEGLRQFVSETLPRLLMEHIDTVDRVTASFLQQAGAVASSPELACTA